MRVSEEPNVDVLRAKARVLETENERLSTRIAEVLREILTLKGMTASELELNLPGLCAQAAGSSSSQVTRPGNERQQKQNGTGEKKKPKRGHGPTKQPKLRLVEETISFDDADKMCPCCGDLMVDWPDQHDEVERVDVVQREWIVHSFKLKKCRCPKGCTVETASAPQQLIDGGRHTTNVAITAAVDKYVDQIPLDRQVRIALRQGAFLTTQTLWDQVNALAFRFEPLAARIQAHVLSQPVIGVDESPFPLIKKGGSEKWQTWQMSCDTARCFEMHETKGADVARQLLAGFSGIAMVDGAKSYESLSSRGELDVVHCWGHGRRNVLKAEKEAPGQVAQFLDLVGKLYAIDRKAARDPPPGDTRRGYRHLIDVDVLRKLRDTESRPLVAELRKWILAQRCIPGGLLKAGLGYVVARWTPLTRFLDDPRIPLDNNQTEGGFIRLAMARRNWRGAASKRGAHVAGTFFTVFESVLMNGGNPDAYARYAIGAILAGEQPLLPHEWIARPADGNA